MAALQLSQAIALTNKPKILKASCWVGRHAAPLMHNQRRCLAAWKPKRRLLTLSMPASEQEGKYAGILY